MGTPVQDIWKYLRCLLIFVECRFLLIVMSCKSSVSVGCSLIWKVLCSQIRTSYSSGLYRSGQTLS